jgi:peptidoglycan/xylan/chitin deacetylase (PgdA/CDA1 family)
MNINTRSIQKSLLKHFIGPMNYYLSNFAIDKNINGKVNILIIHDIPHHQTTILEKLLISLQRDYCFLDPIEFVSYMEGNLKIRGMNIVLTFDDGFESNYRFAKKVLEPNGIKALFFIPSGFIDAPSREKQIEYIRNNIFTGTNISENDIKDLYPMTWDEIKDLNNLGHTVGSHTISHARLSLLKDDRIIADEIVSSAKRIGECTGIKIEHFAFPFGNVESINSNAYRIARTQYRFIYSGVRGANDSTTNPHAIRRQAVSITDNYDYNRFLALGGISAYYWRKQKKLDKMIK